MQHDAAGDARHDRHTPNTVHSDNDDYDVTPELSLIDHNIHDTPHNNRAHSVDETAQDFESRSERIGRQSFGIHEIVADDRTTATAAQRCPVDGLCGSRAVDSYEACPFTQTLVKRSSDAASPAPQFDEGPFFRMLFTLLARMPDQPYQVNLHLTSIVSKLALIPHPDLHDYLLEPSLPTAESTRTLFKTLQGVARRLTVEVPRIKNYRRVIENTRLQLMSEDPAYDEIGEHNQLVESVIVLEEFCKELAAIALVKHQHLHRQTTDDRLAYSH